MKLKFLNFLTFTLLSFCAFAQTANVSGHVYIGPEPDAAPMPGYPVMLITGTGDAISTETNDEGFYTIDFELTGDVDPVATLSIFDFCFGETIIEELYSNGTLIYEVDLNVCQDNDPVDPPVGCDAFFYNEQTSVDPYLVNFYDVSYAEPPTTSWSWDFGDAGTSDEQNPEHEYAAIGLYDVILTISSDSCTSTVVYQIEVGEDIGCVCPENWDPVCVATATGDTITFSNLCFAECEGFTIDDVFECDWVDPCDCYFVWDPVCVATPAGDTISFPNLCIAECEGFTEDQVWPCDGWVDPCDCPADEWDPVCVITEFGDIIEFVNPCYAACEGYGEDSFVDCEGGCNCTDEWDPVCVTTPAGVTLTFPNACTAECEGFTEADFVDCENDCNCPDVWEPVCVAGFGGIITFPNACFAECEGFTEADFVDCIEDCLCDDVWDPVCVISPDGIVRLFPNACLAACEGFGEDSFVDCDFEEDCYADFYTESDNPTGGLGLEVHFVDASYANEGEVISWAWDFGDGETSDEQNPIHTYAEEGIYEVLLTITTSEGCASTTVLHLCVGNGGPYQGPDCQAMFYFTQTDDTGSSFAFEDFSLGEVTTWTWDFGDGESSDEQNPSHTYAEPGIYFVTLTVSTEDCESTATMILFANEDAFYEDDCWALFIPLVGDVPGTGGNTAFFLNLSSPNAINHTWDFGDGTSSDEFFPIHEYAEAGVYEVSLTILTEDGCESTFNGTLTIGEDDDDFTGAPEYSLVNATSETAGISKVSSYPNPVADQLTVQFNMAEAGDYSMNLQSIDGRNLQTVSGHATEGLNSQTMKVGELPQGIYFVRIQSGTSSTSYKVIKE